MMNIDNLQRDYISEADKFLYKLRKELPLSESQKETIAKYARIAELRDNPEAGKESVLWEEF